MSVASYGCMAEFATAEQLVGAVLRVRHQGYAHVEAYTPFAVPGLADALGPMHDRVPLAVLLGGLVGGFGTLAIEYWSAVIDYPIDVGGRPNASWPAFIPAALEMCILFAVLFGVVAMLWSNRLPRLYHPVFNVERFGDASRDGFFLVIRADDPQYDEVAVRHCLRELAPVAVEQVPA